MYDSTLREVSMAMIAHVLQKQPPWGLQCLHCSSQDRVNLALCGKDTRVTIPDPRERKGALAPNDVRLAVVSTLSLRFLMSLLNMQQG